MRRASISSPADVQVRRANVPGCDLAAAFAGEVHRVVGADGDALALRLADGSQIDAPCFAPVARPISSAAR